MNEHQTLAESLRQQGQRYHQIADETLASCRYMVAWLAEAESGSEQPAACDMCRRAAEGYRAIALDYTQRAVRQDIVKGVVHR